MNEIVSSVSTAVFIVAWFCIGPLFAIILFHLGEKRWGTGPTWAFLGFLFNVFALVAYFLIAGYESSESNSTGGLEAQRVRQVLDATRGVRTAGRQAQWDRDPREEPPETFDKQIESLLAAQQPAEALALARERRAVAFQLGDASRETLYDGYITLIESDDAERRLQLATHERAAQALTPDGRAAQLQASAASWPPAPGVRRKAS